MLQVSGWNLSLAADYPERGDLWRSTDKAFHLAMTAPFYIVSKSRFTIHPIIYTYGLSYSRLREICGIYSAVCRISGKQ
jgi:hypothetical protein